MRSRRRRRLVGYAHLSCQRRGEAASESEALIGTCVRSGRLADECRPHCCPWPLCHRQAQRHGGIIQPGRVITRTVAESVRRITGQQVTPAQATLLLIACTMVLLWWSGIYDSFVSSWRGGRRSSSWIGPPSSPSSRRRARTAVRAAATTMETVAVASSVGSACRLVFHVLGAMMLGSMVWRLGGGSRPEGWSLGQFFHSVQNMDMWQS